MSAAHVPTAPTIDALLQRGVRATPDETVIVARRVDRDAVRRIGWRELDGMVGKAAAALRAMGVGRGDIVSVQLPNWWEFVVTTLAVARIGAVFLPLLPMLRERDLRYILGHCKAKLLVVPKVYRGHDYAGMVQGIRKELPALERVLVVDGDGPDGFEQALLSGTAAVPAARDAASEALRLDDLALLMFTSGTTGTPKGVMHSSRTLLWGLDAFQDRYKLGSDDVLLAASPVGHMIGYLACLLLALRVGGSVVMEDLWEAKRSVALMAGEGVTFAAGTTPFLSDIVETAKAGVRPARLRLFLCAGAPIPPVLIERARAEMSLTVSSVWGMSESLASTITEPERSAEKASTSDGRAAMGSEVKVVDLDGRPLPPGQPGRLLVRGATLFLGYYERPDLPTWDADGWLDSGDLATMDAEGYIRITGRTKDLIMRGGEKIPVIEIENLLYKHPAVAAVAIVGYPDARLGERAAAFIVPRPGQTLDLAGVQAYLARCEVVKQYWPERVELVEDLPRTPTGKIQKFALRDVAKRFVQA